MVFENCFPPIVAEELVFHVKPENEAYSASPNMTSLCR